MLAVPGHPFDGRAGGCNMLIRDGATLVRGPDDVLAALGHPATPTHGPPVRQPGPSAVPARPAGAAPAHGAVPDLPARILSRLGPSPVAEDQLIRDLDLPVATVTPELVALEVEGRILRQPGGMVALAV